MMKLQFCALVAMCVVVATTASPGPGVCMDAAREANCKDVACLRALDDLPTICQLALKAAAAGAPSRRLRARHLLAEGCSAGSDTDGTICYAGFLCQSGYCAFPATGSGFGSCASTCVSDGQRVAQGDTCSCCSGVTSPAPDSISYCGTPG